MKSTTCQSNPAPALAMRTVTYCIEIKGTPLCESAAACSGVPIVAASLFTSAPRSIRICRLPRQLRARVERRVAALVGRGDRRPPERRARSRARRGSRQTPARSAWRSRRAPSTSHASKTAFSSARSPRLSSSSKFFGNSFFSGPGMLLFRWLVGNGAWAGHTDAMLPTSGVLRMDIADVRPHLLGHWRR